MSPKFMSSPTGHSIFKSAFDELELRKYLTYWDKIDVPRNSLVDFDCWQFRLLEQEGVLTRTLYGTPTITKGALLRNSHNCFLGGNLSVEIDDCTNMTLGKSAGEQIISAHEDVYALRAAQEPGQWSKAQVSTRLLASSYVDKAAIEMEIFSLLPVPTSDTPLEKIIAFKAKRKEQLDEFRLYLDEVYQSIIAAGDVPRAKITEMSRLEQSLKGINLTMKEAGIKYVLDSLRSVRENINEIGGLGAGGAGIATLIGMSPLIAGMAFTGMGIATKFMPQSKYSTPKELVYLRSIKKTFS